VNVSVVAGAAADMQLEILLHKTIRAVTNDIEHLRFNTAIARLMELANALTAVAIRPKAGKSRLTRLCVVADI